MTSHQPDSNGSSSGIEDARGTGTSPMTSIEGARNDNGNVDGSHGEDAHHSEQGSFVVTAVASLAAFGVSMAARPALKALYRTATGHQPPAAEDPAVPFARALVWTVMSAATGAVLEMMVQRATRRFLDTGN